MTQDEDHLRLLSIFQYVVGGLAGLFALFPVFHLVFGLFFILAPGQFKGHGEPPPAFIGWMYVVFAAVIIVIGWVFAGLVLATGRFLTKRRHYLFCLVMGGVECMFMPFGTVLGVFTIILLMREPVKQLFTAKALQAQPGKEVPENQIAFRKGSRCRRQSKTAPTVVMQSHRWRAGSRFASAALARATVTGKDVKQHKAFNFAVD